MRWGPGWEGYKDGEGLMGSLMGGVHCPGRQCLRSNIAARYGSEDYFDIILTDAGTLPDETKEFQNKRTVVAVRRSECVDAGERTHADKTINYVVSR